MNQSTSYDWSNLIFDGPPFSKEFQTLIVANKLTNFCLQGAKVAFWTGLAMIFLKSLYQNNREQRAVKN